MEFCVWTIKLQLRKLRCVTTHFHVWMIHIILVCTWYSRSICFERKYLINMKNNICVGSWRQSQYTTRKMFAIYTGIQVGIQLTKYLHWILMDESLYAKIRLQIRYLWIWLDPDEWVRVPQILDEKCSFCEYCWILTDESGFRKYGMTNMIFVNMIVRYLLLW